MKKLNNNGFHLVELVIALAITALVGFVGWRVVSSSKQKEQKPQSSTQSAKTENSSTDISWEFNGDKWQASPSPPDCKEPLSMNSPVDVSLASGILYPGQTRGGQYKSHGGFRFDGKKNEDITVKVPMDAQLVKGSRYIEQGETQYFLVFIAPCGIMYRLDHLLTLSSAFQKYADTLPEAKVDDSRTTNFSPAVSVQTGETVATAVGFKNSGNVTADFGVNDLRQPNEKSRDKIWSDQHQSQKEYDYFGICWFDLLPANDASTVKSLPAGDSTSGKTSDYCE